MELPCESSRLVPALYPHAMPNEYAMICDGDCMEPFFHHGQTLLFSRTASWQAGDPVVIFRRPETLPAGESQVLFKQLVASPPRDYWAETRIYSKGNVRPLVMAQMLNPRRTLWFDADDILGIHKCTGVQEL